MVFVLGLLGLVLGSFVNALVWRVHEQAEVKEKRPTKQTRARLRELSIMSGRSQCVHCQHQLAAKDLIPVVSWLILRGKCRYCGAKIEDTPIVEFSTAVVFAISYIFWPNGFHGSGLMQFCFWLVFLVGFMALAVYDIKWYLLPDRIVFPLIGLAAVQLVAQLIFFHGGWPLILGAFWGVLISSGIFYILFQISGGAWIGGGDVKLGIVLGLLVGGPFNSMLLLFVASLLGTLTAIPMLLSGKANRKSLIPFGPYLLAAAFVVELFGTHVSTWLNSFIV